MKNKKSEQELQTFVAEAMNGNKRAFTNLCYSIGQRVIYLCVQNMGNQQDGEDAAQEVFILLQKNITQLKNPNAFTSWLYQLIRTACNQQRRKTTKGEYPLPIEEYNNFIAEENHAFLPQQFVENDEKRAQLLQIIQNLPQQTRMCVVLYYFEEQTREEVAKAMGITPHSVSVTLTRARKQIKQQIEKMDTPTGQVLLPMAALTGVLQTDANAKVPFVVVAHCIEKAGVTTLAAPGALAGTSFLKSGTAFVLAALCTVAVVGATLCYTLTSASTPLAVAPPQQSLPQGSAQSVAPASGIEDIAVASSAAQPASLPPAQVPQPAPGGLTQTPQSIATVAPQVTGAYTQVYGHVLLLDTAGNALPDSGWYAVEYTVQLIEETTANIVATTVVGQDGSYQFAPLPVPQTQNYTLQLVPATSLLPVFAQGAAYTVTLVPGMASVQAPVLYIQDITAPVVGIYLQDEQGNSTAVNPLLANILLSDATQTSCNWEVLQEETGAILATGTDTIAPLQQLKQQGHTGQLLLRATATDAAGNTGTASATFYVY
ncbi:sigma-70 family RNA polymerase sigma factor [Ruminococcaceae bacterium OttesenSCG-928-A16]|nr:sigma-70 family RNA polymerase sigma factor [Ruminococcaceae bacterium OttesenSCG-928-A16]